MNHTDFGTMLAMASATSVGERCRRLAENLLTSSQASAVGLMAISPEDGSHREVLNVEYPPETFRYHATARYTRRCHGLKQIFRYPEVIQCWDDIPNFRESYEAQTVYGPAGYRNGISMVLRAPTGATVALLHVSIRDEHVESETKDLLGSVRPVLTEWATILARFELARLSAREAQVLSLMRDGLSNAEIAEELVLAPRTVSTHVETILRKLAAENRTEAAVLAERYGLTRPAPRVTVASLQRSR